MLTQSEVQNFASHWIKAWNAHDLDEIISHYASDVVLVSPVVTKLLNNPSGTIIGKDSLRAYFKTGLEAYPHLKFELIDVMWGLSSIILYYVNQKGGKTGEFMEINENGKVSRVIANYNS